MNEHCCQIKITFPNYAKAASNSAIQNKTKILNTRTCKQPGNLSSENYFRNTK